MVGAVFVGLAWVRGTRPGPGTLVQWVFVGVVISAVMAWIPDVGSLPVRVAMLVGALALITVGVAGLPRQRDRRRPGRGDGPRVGPAGAVPVELQPGAVRRGADRWALGAAVGPGTVVVFLLLGPAVDVFRRAFPTLERAPVRPAAAPTAGAGRPADR